jgi:hypothetical protein
MNPRKIAAFALLLAAVSAFAAPAAHATYVVAGPSHTYRCYFYSDTAFLGLGTSRFDVPGAGSINWGIEYFKNPGMSFEDNRRVAFAKPVEFPGWTQWEYTIVNASQCKDTRVSPGQVLLYDCTDHLHRECFLIN